MAIKCKDFDKFIAERENKKIPVRIFGRDCLVPSELPWYYMLKVERMFATGEVISGEENIKLVKRMLSSDDFEFVTEHPRFRASYFWELIAFVYMRNDSEPTQSGPVFQTEDDIKIKKTHEGNEKNVQSAQ